MPHPENDFSRLELNLPACQENYRYFRARLEPSTKLLVLVKANAYGHGAVEFAAMMQGCGADYLAVALPLEGVELRQAGISLPILRDFPIHIKLDTGMHRLGFMPGELQDLFDFLRDCPWVKVKSVYSHLAAAEDPESDDFTLGQIGMFKAGADALSASLGYKPMYHVLNSAGIERFPQFQFDMVRLGIGIYGISSLPGVRLSPVASLKVKVLQIKTLGPQDGTIGYGRYGHIAPEGTIIATIPVGYADGIDRHLGRGRASFSLNGHRVPTIGNICMDMCMLDVTGVPAKAGDTVTVFGADPTVSELADILGTIPYEIMTSVPRRIERVIIRKRQ